MTTATLSTTDPTIGGNDTITTGAGIDTVLGGVGGDLVDLGDGNDLALGDNGQVLWDIRAGAPQVVLARVTDDAVGGNDRIYGRGGDDVLIGGNANDAVDGGTGRDLIFGDNATVDRTTSYGTYTSPRFRTLSAGQTQIYSTALDTAGRPNVDSAWQVDPAGAPLWADFRLTLMDHTATTTSGFGNDYLAGGAGDDLIFGQLGNDVIQGDGTHRPDRSEPRRDAAGDLTVVAVAGSATDGNDYIEGGGGNDVIFGGLGQDDIIGGSSSLFSLVDAGAAPRRRRHRSSAAPAPRSAATTRRRSAAATPATPTRSSATTATSSGSSA